MTVEKVILPITDAEWEVMRVVWATGETTSREVTAILNEKTEWKNTTVKTLLSRLVEKEMLGTRKLGNKFVYYPLVEERVSLEALTSELLAKVCSKKVGDLLSTVIQQSELSISDVEQLQQLLQEKSKTAVATVTCNCIPGQCQCKHIK